MQRLTETKLLRRREIALIIQLLPLHRRFPDLGKKMEGDLVYVSFANNDGNAAFRESKVDVKQKFI